MWSRLRIARANHNEYNMKGAFSKHQKRRRRNKKIIVFTCIVSTCRTGHTRAIIDLVHILADINLYSNIKWSSLKLYLSNIHFLFTQKFQGCLHCVLYSYSFIYRFANVLILRSNNWLCTISNAILYQVKQQQL